MNRSMPGPPVHHQLPEFIQTHVHRIGDAIQASDPLSSPSPLASPFSSCLQFLPASGSFSNESTLRMRWPKYWSFSFSINPFNEYSGLISFICKLSIISFIQISHSVMSDPLWPHESQHARLPCPSPAPEACTDSFPSSQWCHPAISSSVIPFSSHQFFPASGSFPRSQFFTSGGPKYWSFSFSISPSNEYSGLISFRMDWLDLLAVQATLKSLLQHHSLKASILRCSAFFIVQLSHPYMTTGKTIALIRCTFVS